LPVSFYLFFYKQDLKQHLLEELKFKFPSLSLSFSNKDFISMKGLESDLKKLQKTKLIYALRSGHFISKNETPLEEFQNIKVGPNQFWSYEMIKNSYDFLDYKLPDLPPEIPARAYHKVSEAQSIMELGIEPGDNVVEIGSAPGGISYYLLDMDVNLTAIDPAKMDSDLLEKYPQKLTHLQNSIFDIEKRHLPRNIDWIISDLNLDGDLNINQSLKIMDFYPKLKGAFLTIKTPKPSDCRRIKGWEAFFRGKYSIRVCNLPSHKKEIGFILKTKG